MSSLHSRKIKIPVKALKIELKLKKNLSSSEQWGALKFLDTSFLSSLYLLECSQYLKKSFIDSKI